MVEIRRIQHSVDRYGKRFLNRVYTAAEQAYCMRKRNAAESFAARFAAKEAGAKALGTGIAQGVGWQDLGVINDDAGRPVLEVTGGARARLNALTPPGMIAQVHLSLSDDYPLAQAFVVISAIHQSGSSPVLPAIPHPVPAACP